MRCNMENDDISSIVVLLDQRMAELKRETRAMGSTDRNKVVEIVLDMRWQLARALTCIGKSEDARKN